MSKILKSVTLGDVKIGGIFRALGKEFVKLDADEHGCLVLAKEIWTRMPFREGDDPECPNDLRRSEIMPYLGNCLAEFTKNGTPLSTFIPLRIDLQDTTGQNEYGIFEVRIGLLTLRGYGKYWRLIPKVDAPWWLATPYGTPNCSPYTSNTNFGESDWAVTFTYDHGHQPAPGDFDQVDRDWTNFTRRLKRFCKKMGREASKWMQVAEYSVVDEDGKVTGRHHHHAILQGNLTWQEIKDLWRDSTGRPMGLVKVEPIDLTCSSFERLTTYMTKARARIRRWRQSQGLQKPKTPRPNDTRWSRKRFDEAFALPDDREYWEKKYPGYTLRECEQHITGNNTKHLIVKLKKKPDTRRKNRRNQP